MHDARCAAITKAAFPFRGQNATFFALLVARKCGVSSALCNFPLVSRSASLYGRLAGFPGIPLLRLHFREARALTRLTLSAFANVLSFRVRVLLLKRKATCNRRVCHRRFVRNQLFIITHGKKKKRKRTTRIYHITYSNVCHERESPRNCAYVATARHAS